LHFDDGCRGRSHNNFPLGAASNEGAAHGCESNECFCCHNGISITHIPKQMRESVKKKPAQGKLVVAGVNWAGGLLGLPQSRLAADGL
jgi:hypothetical protein